MEWFNKFMIKFKIAKSDYTINNKYKENVIPPQIDNSILILTNDSLSAKQWTNSYNHTGEILKDGLKINQDFTVINESLFKFISKYHPWDNPIIRYENNLKIFF